MVTDHQTSWSDLKKNIQTLLRVFILGEGFGKIYIVDFVQKDRDAFHWKKYISSSIIELFNIFACDQ